MSTDEFPYIKENMKAFIELTKPEKGLELKDQKEVEDIKANLGGKLSDIQYNSVKQSNPEQTNKSKNGKPGREI